MLDHRQDDRRGSAGSNSHSLFDMHDGLVAATHRVHGTEAIVSKDEAFRDAGLDTVWD